MAIKKGVVLEIEGPEAIVLTDRGEFERIPLGRRQLDIGMEITLPSRRRSSLLFGRAWTGWVAGVAAVLMLMAIVPLLSQVQQSDGEVVAYVHIDINPSIELAVNDNEKVVAAEPFNNDGRRILSEVRVVGQDMEEAVAHITEQAVEDGFINKSAKNAVMIALTPASGQRVAGVWEKRLEQSVNTALSEQHQVAVVDTRIGSTELRLNAKKQGLSVGKFMVLLAAKEKNLDITVAQVKKSPIGEVIQKKGGSPEELVKIAHNTKDWDRMAAKFESELGDGNPAPTSVAALPKPAVDKDTAGKLDGTVVAAKDGKDKADDKPGVTQPDDQAKEPPGIYSIVEHKGGKKPKKPQDGGKAVEPGQGGNPASGQGSDKKPDDPANGAKPAEPANANGTKAGEPANGTKPGDGQSPGNVNTGTQDAVKNPADQAKVQNSGDSVTVQAGAASAQPPADTATQNTGDVQDPANP